MDIRLSICSWISAILACWDGHAVETPVGLDPKILKEGSKVQLQVRDLEIAKILAHIEQQTGNRIDSSRLPPKILDRKLSWLIRKIVY